MKSIRRAVRLVVAAGVLTTGLMAMPHAAYAGASGTVTECGPTITSDRGGYYEESYVCVHKNAKNYIWASVHYLNAYDVSSGGRSEHRVDAYIALERCQTGMRNCSYVTSATYTGQSTEDGWFARNSPAVSGSYGWVYRGCADLEVSSGYRYYDQCSGWVNGNPPEVSIIIG